jgi:inhibitor of KinA|tara:strand:- start:15893 stop:16555 length:663 start_codon:yes stop_codon:yes gene_type:complete
MQIYNISFHGDSTLVINFGKGIDENTNNTVHFYINILEKKIINKPFILDIYPTYNSVVIDYDFNLIESFMLKIIIKRIISENKIELNNNNNNKIIEIPVSYGGEFGPDLLQMSKSLGFSEKEIISIHSSKKYRVHMLGFMPGFPYLGGLDKSISFPRLTEPRTSIPAGSVGIAGNQTGIYPFSSPGGWNIIGMTNIKLFDINKSPPNFIESGTYLRFVAN